ncbi:hypothetical protein B296_00025628, partial [Ensete ventricosum]
VVGHLTEAETWLPGRVPLRHHVGHTLGGSPPVAWQETPSWPRRERWAVRDPWLSSRETATSAEGGTFLCRRSLFFGLSALLRTISEAGFLNRFPPIPPRPLVRKRDRLKEAKRRREGRGGGRAQES